VSEDHYDVFLSYAHADASIARPLRDALVAAGLAVFFDEDRIEDFDGITANLDTGLAHSTALVAVYSVTYPARRACEFELTAAFLAAQRVGDPRARVLVVNPEDGVNHIEPLEIRDTLFRPAPAPDDADAFAGIAAAISEHVGTLTGAIGELSALTPPPWFGTRGGSSTRFVGRLHSMWAIHSILHAGQFRPLTAATGPGVAQVRGLAGVGKSLLAAEYALRFGSSYPGGVYWLRASDENGADQSSSPEADPAATRISQLQALALDVGIDLPTKPSEEAQIVSSLRDWFEQRRQACLWIVDDLPPGLNSDEVRRWFAPHPLAKTLLTTRSRDYDAIAEEVDPGNLSPTEGLQLLCARRRPDGEAEERAAEEIVADLGGHALALDITGAALAHGAGLLTFVQFRDRLRAPDADELELAGELIGALPTGHEASIAATINRSLKRLGEEAWDLVRVATILGPEPVPAWLVPATFVAADACDEHVALTRALRALAATDSHSLSEDVGDGDRSVHELVRRTVRFVDPSPERRVALRAAAVSVLVRRLARVERWYMDGVGLEYLLHAIFTSTDDLANLPALLEDYALVPRGPGEDEMAARIARDVHVSLPAKLQLFKLLLRYADGYTWEWSHWRYTGEPWDEGVTGALGAELKSAPMECLPELVKWLDDRHNLTQSWVTVADVAAGLLWRSRDLGFEYLCELLVEAPSETRQLGLLRELAADAPEQILTVCKHWSESGDPVREDLAAWSARKAFLSGELNDDGVNPRAVEILRRLLLTSTSQQALNEVLGALISIRSTQGEVIHEVVRRAVSGDPNITVWTLTPAFQDHFDTVIAAFREYLSWGGQPKEVIGALGSYMGRDPQQVARVVYELESIWEPGGPLDYPVAQAVESLLRMTGKVAQGPADLLRLGERLIQEGSPSARTPLEYVATDVDARATAAYRAAQKRLLDLLIDTATTDELSNLFSKLVAGPAAIASILDQVVSTRPEEPRELEWRLLGRAYTNKALARGLACWMGSDGSHVPAGDDAREFVALLASGLDPTEAVRRIIRRRVDRLKGDELS
jgi:hypothetical protein